VINGCPMALTADQLRELERLTADIVRQRLPYAGAGAAAGSIVPGLADGKMLRGDVADWLARQDRALRDRAVQRDTLWWAKAAAWIAGVRIVVGAARIFSRSLNASDHDHNRLSGHAQLRC